MAGGPKHARRTIGSGPKCLSPISLWGHFSSRVAPKRPPRAASQRPTVAHSGPRLIGCSGRPPLGPKTSCGRPHADQTHRPLGAAQLDPRAPVELPLRAGQLLLLLRVGQPIFCPERARATKRPAVLRLPRQVPGGQRAVCWLVARANWPSSADHTHLLVAYGASGHQFARSERANWAPILASSGRRQSAAGPLASARPQLHSGPLTRLAGRPLDRKNRSLIDTNNAD